MATSWSFKRRQKFLRLFDRRREVRIREQHDLAARLQRAVTHAIALAAIRAVRQHPQLGNFSLEGLGYLRSAIRGPVVHHDNFGILFLTRDIACDLFQCCGQAQLFVERRYDDRELGDGIAHQIHTSFHPWRPTRGTNRQGSLRSELSFPPCWVSRRRS